MPQVFLERLDVPAHQNAPGSGIDTFVEHRDDATAQALARCLGGKIGAVERIGAGDADRNRQQRTHHLECGHEPRTGSTLCAAEIDTWIDGRRVVRVRMKRRIAPGHQHGKPRIKTSRFHRHEIIADKFGPDWGAIGEFRLRFITKRTGSTLPAASQDRDEKAVGGGRPRRHQIPSPDSRAALPNIKARSPSA